MERRPRDPEVWRHLFQDDGHLPNNPKLPLLVYLGALSVYDDLSSECEAWSGENGWGGAWRGRVFTYHHYHSSVHEVLGIVRGTAHLVLDGESGAALELETGDVAVTVAGVGQCNQGPARAFWPLAPTRVGSPGTCAPASLANDPRSSRTCAGWR